MTESVRVKDLLALPERVHKGDFVLKLTEGIEDAERTASTYVVTPALAHAFGEALAQVRMALQSGESKGAYLHGSFGSGKSHFMALLSLLMQDAEPAWRIPALHALREQFAPIAGKKLLQLHFHMVGQESIEGAVFGQYLAYLGKHHADAPLPGLFADEQLFADAARLLDELGDEAFFAPMNEGGTSRLRRKGQGGGWDRERFERLRSSSDPRQREELFSALVKTRFGSYARESRAFVDFDSGLAVMARHASELGYAGIVLFLDELILWLAARASNSAQLHREIQKMVKLVESQNSARAVPIISFIARQQALSAMVGPDYAGAEAKKLEDALKHWHDRFHTISLETSNLPAIVEQRVVKPRDAAARARIDGAFEQLQRDSGKSWAVMLGELDAAAFRKLYPFSPALVDALIGVSSLLQRDRTAIRVLMELLVDHIEDLRLGEVVRVGDLFDAVAEGADAADTANRGRFQSAKSLYKHQLLPMLREHNGTTERCPRERNDHPVRLGCAGCAEVACRTDNRIAKTLLVAALVPEVKALQNMTASRLVALNHGTLSAPVRGTEAQLVAQKLRKWATVLGQLHVGNQPDPTVSLQLEGVDPEQILKRAVEVDTPGARQRYLRDLLFETMGVDKTADWGVDHPVEWRETDRKGHVRFGNVRKLPPELLRCPDGYDWWLVVDYPFDDPEFGPAADVEVVERVRDEGTGTWTLVWLPSFFSESINNLLGSLVVLHHVLENNESVRKYTAHLSVEQQARARNDLENLRSSRRTHVMRALEQAYGLARPEPDTLDSARSITEHLFVLKPGASVSHEAASNLADALQRYIPKLLEVRYARHPKFTHKLTKPRVAELVDKFGEIIDSEDKKIPADKQLVQMMGGTLGALDLVRVTEGAVHLLPDKTLQDLEKRREQLSVDSPSAEEVRRWFDELHQRRMGLQAAAQDLVVRCYARAYARTLVLNGKPYAPDGRDIPGAVVLERPDLPSPEDWAKALAMVSTLFAQSFPGRALHADTLKRFEEAVAKFVAARVDAAGKLPGKLAQRLAQLGLPAACDRATTAAACKELLERLRGRDGKASVEVLAAVQPQTSAKAMQASLLATAECASALESNLVFGVFQQLQGTAATLVGAQELLDEVAALLRQDELVKKLGPGLHSLAERAQDMMRPSVTPPPPGKGVYAGEQLASGKAAASAALDGLLAQARDELDGSDEGTFVVRLSIERKGS